MVRRGKPKAEATGVRSDATRPQHHGERPKRRQAERSNLRGFIPVYGARRIWGTLSTTTVRAVEKAINGLTTIPAGKLTLKRKYKIAKDNSNPTNKRVVRWRFVY